MYKKIAQRYAKALAFLIKDKSDLIRTEAELKLFSKLYTQTLLCKLFENPSFETGKQISIIKKMKFGKELERCINVIIMNKRIKILKQLSEAYSGELNKNFKKAKALVTVSARLNSTEKIDTMIKGLEKRLNKSIYYKISIDPSILGGIRIQLGNVVFDNTLISKFSILERTLCNN
jgi:F-type H+-transporting ATPase subunit delta